MKKLINMKFMRVCTLTLILLLVNISLYGQGIEFFNGTYAEAKALANQNNKNIFVDAYTTWCGPCKRMVKETFTDSKVGAYFEQNFIAIQIDAENESESEFFSEYTATAYPSLFWLDNNGDLLDIHIGFLDASGFLEATKLALEKNLMANYKSLEKRWHNEDRTFELYKEYSNIAYKVNPSIGQTIAEEYIYGLTEKELLTPESFSVLQSFMRRGMNNDLFIMLVKNWDHYMTASESPEEDWSRLYSSIVRIASIHRNNKDIEAYNQQVKHLEELEFQHKDLFLESIELENLLFDKKYSDGIDKMIELTNKYSDKSFLYDNYYYTLILSDYFLRDEVDLKEAEKLISFTRKNAKIKATQKSMLFMAIAYANKKDYKTAYEYLASLGFYPKPMLSNALYGKLNLPIPRNEFPW